VAGVGIGKGGLKWGDSNIVGWGNKDRRQSARHILTMEERGKKRKQMGKKKARYKQRKGK
jgi:ribosomal protein S9